MSERGRSDAEQELDGLAEDWIALWQSEVAGLMADPETAEAWGSLLGLGAAWLRALMPGQPFAAPPPWAQAHEPPAEPAHGAARPTAAAAAPAAEREPRQPGPGQSAGAGQEPGLAEHLAELERRVAELERRPGGSGADSRRPRRRRPSA